MDLLNLPNVSFREFVHRPDMDSRCAYRPARPTESLSFRHSYYPLTLQCAPSESTNCASKPPKSCFVGGILNRTPFAFISWWNLSRSGTLKPRDIPYFPMLKEAPPRKGFLEYSDF